MRYRGPVRRVAALLVVPVVLLLGGCSAGRLWPLGTSTLDVIVVGDSLSTGVATAGVPWTVDARALYARQHQPVRFVNVAENGAGYIATGVHGDTFLDEAAKAVGPRSKIVLVFGSDNDVGRPGLDQGVRATLARIRLVASHAAIIVVGPPAPPAQQRAPLLAIRDVLRSATAEVGGRFVDPLDLDWFEGSGVDDVAADLEHPNARGEQFLAQQMTAVLAPTVRNLTRT